MWDALKRCKRVFLAILVCACFLQPFTATYAQDQEGPDVLYNRGLSLFSSGDYAGAVDNFEQLISIFGNEEEMQAALEVVYYAMGSAYYNLQEYEKASQTFELYITRYPEAKYKDEALFRIAAGFQNEEDYEKAIDGYRRLLSEVPFSEYAEDAAFQIGVCYLRFDDFEKVIDAFTSFTEAFPRSELFAQARIYIAKAHFELSQYIEALEVIESLDNYHRSIDHIVYANFLALEIGDLTFDDTEYETALRAYRRVRTRESLIRLQEKYITRLQYQMKSLHRERKTADSMKSFFRKERRVRRALASASDMLKRLEDMPAYDAGLFHRIGSCFFSTDRYWEARVAFKRVVREAVDKDIKEAAHFDLALVLSGLRRFPELASEADAYLESFKDEEKFIKNGRVASMAFMRAESYVNEERYEEAEKEMLRLQKEFPQFVQMERVEFYIALSVSMQERFEEGIARFRDWLRSYPDHMLRPEVEYWLPISLYYKGDYKEAIPLFREYAQKYPMSVYTPEAGYREAMCFYAMEDFASCGAKLEEWIPQHKDHYFYWEAIINCGDALGGVGRLDEAKAYYNMVGPESGNFYYKALTQAAKVYKALDTTADYAEMSNRFADYIKSNPTSPNIIEAAYHAGWALRQIERTEDARRFYWSIITRYGNTREWEGFTSLFGDLKKMYALEERDLLRQEFAETRAKAERDSRRTLMARLDQAMISQTNEAERITQSYETADRYDLEELGSESLAFLGSFYMEQGKKERAWPYLEQLLSDFPESRNVAIAHVEKGFGYLEQGNYTSALASANSCLEFALEADIFMRATFLRATAYQGLEEYEKAVEEYNVVLANRAAPRPLKPKAMLGIAACQEALGAYDKAIPYYQRIYVLYGAYRDAVAEAYLKSGLAFEKISDRDAAIKTYQELLAEEDLADSPQAEQARLRLRELNA